MMNKILTILFLFTYVFSFSPTEKENYQIYSQILGNQLELGIGNKVDSIVVVEQYKNKYGDLEVDDVWFATEEIISDVAINSLYTQTYKDTAFIRRIINEPVLKRVILGLVNNFQNHPRIEARLFESGNIHIRTISSQKYHSFFGKKYKRISQGWRRIENKYGTRNVIEFSKIYYEENFASLYYAKYCGGLCGTGNIVILERKNGKWAIVTEINLWMS